MCCHTHTLPVSIQWNYRPVKSPLFWVKTFTGYLGNAAHLSSAKRLAVLADLKTLMFRLFHSWISLSSPSSHLLSLLFCRFYLFGRGLVAWASLQGLMRQTLWWNINAMLLRADVFHILLLLLQIYCLTNNCFFHHRIFFLQFCGKRVWKRFLWAGSDDECASKVQHKVWIKG